MHPFVRFLNSPPLVRWGRFSLSLFSLSRCFVMPVLSMRRQSSVVKVTLKALRWLSAACVDSCGGFIARYKGVEHGIVSVIGQLFVTYEGELLEARECCVRRGTVESIRAEANASLIGAGLCA